MIRHTLSNGLPIVAQTASGPVSYIGLAVNAGSRDDPRDAFGLAHFLEHTIFKGTERRSAWYISNRMESVGGELNAYTTKELTMVYTLAPAGNAERAIRLLAELVTEASFPAAGTERERDIVIEEIHSYMDSPSDLVFDKFDEYLFAGSGMAHNILGSEESVRALAGSQARRFLDRFYVPANMAIYCVDSNPERAIRLVEKHFGAMSHHFEGHSRVTPPEAPRFDETLDRDNYQANILTGCRLPGRSHPLRHALMLFNNILGGPALNSRLCQQVRERRGLAYSIESNVVQYSDCGIFSVYAGADPAQRKRVMRIIGNEIDRLAQAPLSPRAFAQLRDQYCGQLSVAADNRESSAMALGRTLLLYGEPRTLADTVEAIRALTPDLLLEAARLVANSEFSTFCIL